MQPLNSQLIPHHEFQSTSMKFFVNYYHVHRKSCTNTRGSLPTSCSTYLTVPSAATALLQDEEVGHQRAAHARGIMQDPLATVIPPSLHLTHPSLHHVPHFHAGPFYVAVLPAVTVTPDHGTAPSETGLSRFIPGIISYQRLTFPTGLALSSSAPERRSTARHN